MPKTITVNATGQLLGRTRRTKTVKGKRRTETAKKISMIINSGNPMQVAAYYRPVIIDMAGARFDKEKTPVIADHDTKMRVGYTTKNMILQAGKSGTVGKTNITGPAIIAEGVFASSMGIAKGILADLKAGYPFEMSVGGPVIKSQFIDADEVVEVNGQMYEGPIVVAREFVVKEASIVVLGADSATALLLASQGENDMDFNKWLVAQGFEPDKMTAAQKKSMKNVWEKLEASSPAEVPAPTQTTPAPETPAPTPIQATISQEDLIRQTNEIQAANLRRNNAIQATVVQYNHREDLRINVEGSGDEGFTLQEYQVHAMENNIPADQFELEVLRATRSLSQRESPAGHSVNRDKLEANALVASVCRTLGMSTSGTTKGGNAIGLQAHFSDDVLNASDEVVYRNVSLHSLMDMNIQAAGQHYSGARKSNDFIRAFNKAEQFITASTNFSTLAVTNILENVANKMLLDSWNAQDVVWDQLTAEKSLSDFKAHSMYRLTVDGGYDKVGAGGELKHGSLADTKQTLQGDTYGMMLSLTRKDMINDDLNAFTSIPTNLGRLAAIALEFAVFALILDNTGTFFTSGRKNLLSGASLDVDIAGMTAMTALFDNQVIDDKPILLTPDRVLVGAQDRIPAAQLYQETKVDVTTTANKPQFKANPHVGALRPIVSSIMNNTSIKKMDKSAFTTQNANHWIAMTNPAQLAAWYVGFLNGNKTPVIESEEASFNTLGRQWRSYHDWGVGEGDYQAACYSPGV